MTELLKKYVGDVIESAIYSARMGKQELRIIITDGIKAEATFISGITMDTAVDKNILIGMEANLLFNKLKGQDAKGSKSSELSNNNSRSSLKFTSSQDPVQYTFKELKKDINDMRKSNHINKCSYDFFRVKIMRKSGIDIKKRGR